MNTSYITFQRILISLILSAYGMHNAIVILLVAVVFPSTIAGIVLCIIATVKLSKMEANLKKGLFIGFIGGIAYVPAFLFVCTIFFNSNGAILLYCILQVLMAIVAIVLNRVAYLGFPKIEKEVKQNTNNEYSNFTERDYPDMDDSSLGEDTPKESSSKRNSSNQVELLLKLKELYDSGAISDLEYEEMKKKIIKEFL